MPKSKSKKTYTSKSGKKWTPKQKALYYATDGFKKKPKKKNPKK